MFLKLFFYFYTIIINHKKIETMKTYTATYNGKDKTEQAQFQAHNLKEAKSHAQFFKRKNISFTCQTIINVNK